MKQHYLKLIIFSFLILCSCKQKEIKDIKEVVKKVNPKSIVTEEKLFVFGIDISHFSNNEVDLLSKSKDSIQFIICKATEGINYIDPKFNANWRAIKEKGFIRGAYHFYITQDDPIAQAKNFLKAIANIEKNDIPPIIDFEEGGIIDKTQPLEAIHSNLLIFIKAIEQQANVTPIIYTNINFGNKYLNNPIFSKYPLWIADYTVKEKPYLPNTWKTKGYLFWQKSNKSKIVNTIDDADIFNGNLTKLKTFIKNSYH